MQSASPEKIEPPRYRIICSGCGSDFQTADPKHKLCPRCTREEKSNLRRSQ